MPRIRVDSLTIDTLVVFCSGQGMIVLGLSTFRLALVDIKKFRQLYHGLNLEQKGQRISLKLMGNSTMEHTAINAMVIMT